MIANYLLRPQPLHRRPQHDGMQALSELVELIVLLVREQAAGGTSLQKIGETLQSSVATLRTDLDARLQNSGTKIRDWFQPVLDTVQAGVAAAGNVNSLEGLFSTLEVMLQLANQALEPLEADDLAAKLNELCDILENDLGLSQRRLERWFSDFIEAVPTHLSADYMAGNTSPEALRQFHIGAKITALHGHLSELTALIPNLDRRALIRELATTMKERDWDAAIAQLRQYGTQAQNALSQIGQQTSNVNRSARAGAVLPNQTNNLPAKRDVGAPTATQYSWYASWYFESQFGFEAGRLNDRSQLNDASLEGRISFKNIPPDFLENWAHWTAVGEDAGAALWHLLTKEEGDEANAWTQFAWQIAHGLTRSFAYVQDSDAWVTFFKVWENYFFRYGIAGLGAGLAGLENSPDKFLGWLHARFLPNFGKTMMYGMWLQHLRQFTLSLFTLANHDGSAATAENFKKSDGFTLPFVHASIILGAWLPSVLWEGKKHYGFPLSNNSGSWLSLATYWIVGGIGMGFVGGLSGWALAGAISGKLSDDYWGKSASWQLPLLGAGLWPIYTWLLWEGSTDGGKWGLNASGEAVPFAGYPTRDTSPYRLPFPADTLRQCVEGHHGVWSNNAKTEHLFALDFAFDYGSEILAMRGGTVVSFKDDAEDDSDRAVNNIIIEHNDVFEGGGPDPAHDRDRLEGTPAQATVKRTYAEYMNGRTDGIRLAFAARGIPPSAIQGSRVQQGDLIMLAGNTGRSAYNHLHVHVMTSAPGARPYTTIPWVVQDVSESGLPRSWHFYKSENTRRAAPANYAVVQPYDTAGVIRAAGTDWIELNAPASQRDNVYKDCHVLLKYRADGSEYFQFRKIVGYQGGDRRRTTVDPPWDHIPPSDARYEIGAKPYPQSTFPWKGCAFLADRDSTGAAIPFQADNRPPDKMVAIAHLAHNTFAGNFLDGLANEKTIRWQPIGASPQTWEGRSLAVERDGKLLLYRNITGFEAVFQRIEVNENWGIDLNPETDTLHIGNLPYATSSDADKKTAFLADSSTDSPRNALDFPDNRKPYVYLNFKLQP